jgi:uncharacterized protein
MPPKRQFRNGLTGSAITVRVSPRSSRNEITEILEDGTIKIRLTAAPVDGAANTALIKLLADVLEIAPSQIEIVAGQSGKDKLITITGLESDLVQQKILARLARKNG